MDRKFRIGVILLLSGVLVMQMAIYLKIPKAPPTVSDLRNAKGKARKAIYMRQPLVQVDGRVDIMNTPLEVEISR